MRFLEVGLGFAAVAFVVSNGVLSALIALFWRIARPSGRRSGSLFVMRMIPATVSAGLVVGLVLPAYGLFEPRGTTERLSPALVGFVILAGVLVAAGLHRAFVSWLDTRRLERAWRTAAIGRVRVGIPVRAYQVPTAAPLAALVGIIRPRLFVSDRFLDALTADERQAVLEHEAGHVRSLDNLKRTLMRLAPDWISFSSAGREIETAWAVAAEEEADDHAVGPDRGRSLDLAGALLKAVRLTPVRCAPASNFYDGATVARRVARLLKDAPLRRAPAPPAARPLVWLPAVLAAAALLSGSALRAAYAATEAAIRLLQ
jgi:hypothetical protein